jgi:DNA repair ATPase RecN
MKNNFLKTSLSLLLMLPLYTHADVSSTTLATSTKEVASSTEQTKNSPDQDFTLCQQQAIETRDNDIAASRSLYNTAMASALTDRKNKEKAAVAITDKDTKKAAIKTSVDTYKNLVKKAQNDLTDARKVAWQTFEDNIQKCHDIQDSATQDIVSSEQNSTETTKEQVEMPGASFKKESKDTSDEGSSFKNVFKAIKSLFD